MTEAVKGSLALLALLAGLSALDVLAIGVILPALPAMTAELGPQAAGAMTVFLLAFAAGQLICGPLSDRHGRKPVLLAGLCIYVCASFLSALADQAAIVLFGRLLQGLGAASGLVVVRAVIRDLYQGAALARAMSLTTLIYAAVPALAPLLGGLLAFQFGWRMSFWTIGGLGLGFLVWLVVALPETRARRAGPAGERRPAALLLSLRGQRGFWRAALATALLSGGLFAFLSAAPSVFIERLGVTPAFFGVFPALTVPGFIAGAALGAWLAGRVSANRVMQGGAALAGLGGLAMIGSGMLAVMTPQAITAALLLATVGLGLALPAGNAAALDSIEESRGGAASALLGALQMLCAAGGSLLGAVLLHVPGLALGLGFTAAWLVLIPLLRACPIGDREEFSAKL